MGWNFVGNNNNPWDDNGHGTHVSGIVGATANDGGIVGVNWDVLIMPIKISDARGFGTWTNAAAGMRYGVDMGARISNNSYGGSVHSQDMLDAIDYAQARGQLVVVAAGNDSKNLDIVGQASYPASYGNDNILVVTATDQSDTKPAWANFGKITVDLGAPGVNIVSTVPTFLSSSGYASASGTSMAAPFVSGAAALLWARNPGMSYGEVKSTLMGSVLPVPSLQRSTVSGGRLELGAVFARITTPVVVGPVQPTPVVTQPPAPIGGKVVAKVGIMSLQPTPEETVQVPQVVIVVRGETFFSATVADALILQAAAFNPNRNILLAQGVSEFFVQQASLDNYEARLIHWQPGPTMMILQATDDELANGSGATDPALPPGPAPVAPPSGNVEVSQNRQLPMNLATLVAVDATVQMEEGNRYATLPALEALPAVEPIQPRTGLAFGLAVAAFLNHYWVSELQPVVCTERRLKKAS